MINLHCSITNWKNSANPDSQVSAVAEKTVLLTSLAMVVMKAGGLAVAMSESACLAERAESAAGLRGSPIVMLNSEVGREGKKKRSIRNID